MLAKYLLIFENMLVQDDDEEGNVKQSSTSGTGRKSDDKIRVVIVKTCKDNSNNWTEVILTVIDYSTIWCDGAIEVYQTHCLNRP